jgi:hypothetical protein
MTFPVVIGGISYSASDFATVLQNPGGGNAVHILGFQLVSAIINVANNANLPANVAATIADAESLLTGISLLTGNVAPSSALGQKMIADGSILDSYNSTPCK